MKHQILSPCLFGPPLPLPKVLFPLTRPPQRRMCMLGRKDQSFFFPLMLQHNFLKEKHSFTAL